MEGGRAHGASASSEFPTIKQLKGEGKPFSPAVQPLARCSLLSAIPGSHTTDRKTELRGGGGDGRVEGTVKGKQSQHCDLLGLFYARPGSRRITQGLMSINECLFPTRS